MSLHKWRKFKLPRLGAVYCVYQVGPVWGAWHTTHDWSAEHLTSQAPLTFMAVWLMNIDDTQLLPPKATLATATRPLPAAPRDVFLHVHLIRKIPRV